MFHLFAWKLLAALGLSLFVVFPGLGDRWFRLGALALNRVARRRIRSLALVGLTSLVLSAAISLLVRMPQPYAHDEFSYLLAGDTFSHGRLTNPTHPMWQHFETFHEIQQPTYASKYPPGQGLALAMGQILTGYPIAGVWLSTALACTAVCWMMYGWLPPRWALAGGLLTVFHPVVVDWSQCYWGGSVAMAGGALLLGALPRIARAPRTCPALLMGLGIAILANSRPYEGLILSLITGAILLWWVVRHPIASRRSRPIRTIFLPLGLVVAVALAAICFYNHRVTGSAFQLPYQLHEATYGITPLFIWQHPRPIPYFRHETLRNFHVNMATVAYRGQTSVASWLSAIRYKYSEVAEMHFPTSFGYLLLPILAVAIVRAILKDVCTRIALLILVAFVLGTLPQIFMSYRYTAPAISLLFVVVMQLFRHVGSWTWRTVPIGRSLVRVCLLACVLALVVTNVRWLTADLNTTRWAANRADLIATLKQIHGTHLVVVRYGPRHSPHQEWVYNEADIDHAPIVWAREMDRPSNKRLLRYFNERKVWLLTIDNDADTPRLAPYPPLGLGGGAAPGSPDPRAATAVPF